MSSKVIRSEISKELLESLGEVIDAAVKQSCREEITERELLALLEGIAHGAMTGAARGVMCLVAARNGTAAAWQDKARELLEQVIREIEPGSLQGRALIEQALADDGVKEEVASERHPEGPHA